MRVCIIGNGGWGTALALVLHSNGHAVTIWGAFAEEVDRARRQRENEPYLPGVSLPPDIRWTHDRAEAADRAELAVLATPTRYYREVAESFRGLLPAACRLVSVSKGLDRDTFHTLTELAREALGAAAVTALSGPSHAEEVARGVPTAVVAASADAGLAKDVQAAFGNPRFRVYTSDDVLGVQLGGALKNVIALAVGVSDGLGFGDNTRAALITRGLAEITRLGVSTGARPETFAGLSGMGDLIVTCTSRHSRNRAVGERLGRGETLEAILSGMKQVAEGVWNCTAARALARRQGVSVPITDQVYAVLNEGLRPAAAVEALMSRDARPELD
jgi:glycerol-3-phosphate dehydrogenase (NAD(P)+)